MPQLTQNIIVKSRYRDIISNKLQTLTENNVTFPEKILLDLIKEHFQKREFTVDELIKEKRHIVLRFLPYHCDLNPIELILAQMKEFIGLYNINNKTNYYAPFLKTGYRFHSVF